MKKSLKPVIPENYIRAENGQYWDDAKDARIISEPHCRRDLTRWRGEEFWYVGLGAESS
jgi:hypothetical protein